MISHQIVRGLVDPTIQEEILSREASTPNMKLEEIVKLVEAKEQGKRSQNLLSNGAVSSIRPEFVSKLNKTKPNENKLAKKCFNCGLHEHVISRLEKQKFSKAYKHQCPICKK